LAPLRVVYAKAGTLPAACVLRDSKAVVDHKLYWTAVASAGEARYLAAILNSETARERTAKYQSRGQWGARDFDKVVFNLPIPRYGTKIKLQRDLADADRGCARRLGKPGSPTRSTRWSPNCSTARDARHLKGAASDWSARARRRLRRGRRG
jgi:hypothetical protein